MPEKKPAFMQSPYFIAEPGNWRLKDGAPEELRREFETFMEKMENDDTFPASINGMRISYPYDS